MKNPRYCNRSLSSWNVGSPVAQRRSRSAKASGNVRKAEKQLKTVMGILPSSDSRYGEAKRMLDGIMATRADEEDD